MNEIFTRFGWWYDEEDNTWNHDVFCGHFEFKPHCGMDAWEHVQTKPYLVRTYVTTIGGLHQFLERLDKGKNWV